jgi:AcrR family transcriptional regulator/transcriptional regulator with XRE-family HTH domain
MTAERTASPPANDQNGQLGARIRAAREARQMSLRRLASEIGISPATVSQIEKGHTAVSVARLSRIAEILETPVSEFIAPAPRPGESTAGPPASPRKETFVRDPAGDWRVYGPLGFDPVLKAALDAFLAVGYHAATVREIAAAAGVSVSGMYHYYSSKQHLLVSILDHTMADLADRAHAARAEGCDPVERFSLLVENLVLFHTHRRELGFVGVSEMRSLEPANRDRIAAQRTAQQRLIDDEVRQAVGAGRFRTDHPHEAARAVVTMCTALPTWWRPDGPCGPDGIAAQYVRFALDLMAHP